VRKGILGVALIGCGAVMVLSVMATHYLGSSPRIAELLELRRGLDSDGRLVRIYYAPKPAPPAGSPGHGLRAIYKFRHGPSHGTLQQQANRLGDAIFKRWAGTPKLAFVEVRDAAIPRDQPGGWLRVEPAANPWDPKPPGTAAPSPGAGGG
jgi:hypothetical protein